MLDPPQKKNKKNTKKNTHKKNQHFPLFSFPLANIKCDIGQMKYDRQKIDQPNP